MDGWIIDKTVDLASETIVPQLIYIQQFDIRANKWIVHVKNNNQDAVLTGYTVSAFFVRSDGSTVTVEGTISQSTVSVVLPSSAYNAVGEMMGILCVEKSDQRITVDRLNFIVKRGRTDIIAPPDEHTTIVGNDPLTTTAQTVTGAINELNSKSAISITNAEIDNIID